MGQPTKQLTILPCASRSLLSDLLYNQLPGMAHPFAVPSSMTCSMAIADSTNRQRESAMEYSPTHIPGVGVLYHSNDGKHLLGDTKVVNPFTSRFKTQERVARAAAVAFANTGESMKELVIGRKAISKPPGTNKRFNRQNYEAGKK